MQGLNKVRTMLFRQVAATDISKDTLVSGLHWLAVKERVVVEGKTL